MDQPPELLNPICCLIGMRDMDLNKWHELGQHKRTVTAVLSNGHIVLSLHGDGSVTTDEVVSDDSQATMQFDIDAVAKAAFAQPHSVFSFGCTPIEVSYAGISPNLLAYKRYTAVKIADRQISPRFAMTRERMWAAFEDSFASELDDEDALCLSCHGLICIGSCYRFYWPEKCNDASGLTWDMMKSAVDVAKAFIMGGNMQDAILRCSMTAFAKVVDSDAMAKTVFRVIINVYGRFMDRK